MADPRPLNHCSGTTTAALRFPAGIVRDAGMSRWRVAAAGALLLLAVAQPSQAQPGTELLLLDVRVNGTTIPGIFSVERMADGRLALPAELWADARLKPPGDPVALADGGRAYVLDAAAGVVYALDRRRLALDITAAAAAFESTSVSLGRALAAATPPPPGAYLNYDVSTTRARRQPATYGALVEGVGFGKWGALVASSVLRADEAQPSAVRLDTYWRTDLPGPMEALVIGDAVGTGGAWSRPVRFAGLRYARDFNLAPGYITYPTPSMSGSAALPSTVDLLINNQRSVQSSVQAGSFELTHVPIVTGAGQIQLVVRDMLGREQVITQSYYIAPLLLMPGLSDFSFEAGALRRNFGTRSNDYTSAFGAGTYRLGLTRALTGEVRAEIERDRVAAGGGIATVVGDLGVVAMAAGYAVANGQRGGHYLASVQRTTPQGGVNIAVERFDAGYRQFGAGPREARPKDQVVAGGGLAFGSGFTAGLSYTRRTTWEGTNFALVGVSIGIALPGNMFVSASATRSLSEGRRFTGGLHLIVPLDDGGMVAASTARDAWGQVANRVQATQPVPAGPGWGWRATASDNQPQGLEASTTYNSRHAQFSAELNADPQASAVRLGANGSLGWMSGLSFASRRIDQGAFAVVHVDDLEGVPVSLSNQVVAVTNRQGLALVTGLLPYQLNQLTLDADLLPFDVEIGGVRETVVPYARAGAFVEFPVRRSRAAMVLLQQPDGSPVPPGARVTVTPGEREFVVAQRGEVYLLGLSDDNTVAVRWRQGSCVLALRMGPTASDDGTTRTGTPSPGPAIATTGPPRLGPLTCRGAH